MRDANSEHNIIMFEMNIYKFIFMCHFTREVWTIHVHLFMCTESGNDVYGSANRIIVKPNFGWEQQKYTQTNSSVHFVDVLRIQIIHFSIVYICLLSWCWTCPLPVLCLHVGLANARVSRVFHSDFYIFFYFIKRFIVASDLDLHSMMCDVI